MPDKEKILADGKKLLEAFSESLEKLPETDETHYVVDIKNITRPDSEGFCDQKFRDRFAELAPHWDFGYLKVKKVKK